jgi:hypothetical protein
MAAPPSGMDGADTKPGSSAEVPGAMMPANAPTVKIKIPKKTQDKDFFMTALLLNIVSIPFSGKSTRKEGRVIGVRSVPPG